MFTNNDERNHVQWIMDMFMCKLNFDMEHIFSLAKSTERPLLHSEVFVSLRETIFHRYKSIWRWWKMDPILLQSVRVRDRVSKWYIYCCWLLLLLLLVVSWFVPFGWMKTPLCIAESESRDKNFFLPKNVGSWSISRKKKNRKFITFSIIAPFSWF